MKILVIYLQFESIQRNTINEHLYSFQKYSRADYFYLNALGGVPKFILKMKFDVVIYHYTFLAIKLNGEYHFKKLLRRCAPLAKLVGLKVAFPQDEYVNSDLLCDFFKGFGVSIVYTCLPSSEYQKVYPFQKSGVKFFQTTLTGYLEENAIETVVKKYLKPHPERELDIGYRSRKLPYWLGALGTLKWRLTEEFQEYHANLKVDLSNDENAVFLGDSWYKFLCGTRTVLGSESGASIHDPNGNIKNRVDEYVSNNPTATFSEAEQACFPGTDGNLRLNVVSPRHFEATITRTTQVLIEGDYNGILKPNLHYISIKKDFSNLPEVIEKIKDINFCEAMAERTYKDLINSKLYTYEYFVTEFFKFITPMVIEKNEPHTPFYSTSLRIYVKFSCFISGVQYKLKVLIFPLVQKSKLLEIYRKRRAV